jgi:putative serine protease PepD
MIAYLRQGALLATAAAVGGAGAMAIGRTTTTANTTTIRRVAVPTAPVNVAATATGLDPTQIYRRDAPGVVVVDAASRRAGPRSALGSGFVIDGRGHILTNAHVVAGAARVMVGFPRGGAFAARVVGLDRIDDVAVLEVASVPRSLLHPLALGTARSLRVGDPVVAIGDPLGEYLSITAGIVSAKRRHINSLEPGYTISDAIQTDAAITRGSSGGPLIDRSGSVVGITNRLLTGTNAPPGANIGVGFAVPIDAARTAARQIIATGRAEHTYLGIAGTEITPPLAQAMHLPVERGVLVGLVRPGSPAARAGLRGGSSTATIDGHTLTVGGDIIVSIAGRNVEHLSDLAQTVSAHRPGSRLTLGVIRAGARLQVPVTLGALPR